MKKNKILSLALSLVFTLGIAGSVNAATAVSLGTADSFSVLAGTGITNIPTSIIIGNVGLSPLAGSNITGLTTIQVTGTIYAVDSSGPAGLAGNNPALLTLAKADLLTAYNNAAGQSVTATIASELGTTTRTAGVYNSADGKFQITGTLTLDGQGNSDSVFIFKTATTLTTAGSSNVVLTNGAQACNVFWQIGSSATLGTDSFLKGNILALTSITLNGGVNVEGRVLARNGAVTLSANTITKATCVTPPKRRTLSNFIAPLINITKIPTPLSLPFGGGSVIYNYEVTNIGTVAISDTNVFDDKCSNVKYLSGDLNNDLKLDISEVWKYSCTQVLSTTITNTATVTGNANGSTAIDTANATVVVGAPIQPPLIHLIKIPNVFSVLTGGSVNYTYTITNPGVVSLSYISLVDDKCSPILGHTGDVNNNNLLDISESWIYTCRTNLSTTTTNTATAEGTANGLTAIDYAIATVVTVSPTFPNTGLDLSGNNISWGTILGGIVTVSVLFYISLRKSIF